MDLYGNMKDYDGIKTACVSLLNETYKLAYKPLVIDYENI